MAKTSEKTPEEPVQKITGAPWVMITGPQGAGKTRLAATAPDLFCLDTESPGAASAYPDSHRKSFEFDDQLYENVINTVDGLLKKTTKEGRVRQNDKIAIAGVTIDTFDTMQKVLINRYLMGSGKRKPAWDKNPIWAPSMEMRDWGVILNYQTPLITKLKQLGIPVIWVCHEKVREPEYDGYGNKLTLRRRGKRGLDVAGSIEGFIVNLCDYVLALSVGEKGQRTVTTQPTVIDDYDILAKDRHNLFKNEKYDMTRFDLPAKQGFPERQVVQFILEKHDY